MKYVLKKTMPFVLMLLFYYHSSAETPSADPISVRRCLALKESPTNVNYFEECVKDWLYKNKREYGKYEFYEFNVQLLFKAIRMGADEAVEDVEDILDYDSEILEEINEQGQSSLIVAIIYRQVKIAKFLIDEGADIDHRDPSGRDALMYAVWFIQPDIVDYLLDKDPGLVSYQDDYGWTAFSMQIYLLDATTTDYERKLLRDIRERLDQAYETFKERLDQAYQRRLREVIEEREMREEREERVREKNFK